MKFKLGLLLLITFILMTSAASAARTRQIVRYDGVSINVIVEGQGPAILLLPSLARDSEDYDGVAEGLAAAGFRVLRPQPRGIGGSTGPMTGISLHDFANDIAEVITDLGDGRAVIVGHAFGNWVARMTAVDHPGLVRGIVIAAAAAKQYPKELTAAINIAGDPSQPKDDRIKALRFAFFAPGNDPRGWLEGWHPQVRDAQRAAVAAVKQSDWWSGGTRPAARPAGRAGPVQARGQAHRDEGRIRRARHHRGHPQRQPRAYPGAAESRGRRARRLGEYAALARAPWTVKCTPDARPCRCSHGCPCAHVQRASMGRRSSTAFRDGCYHG